jgi:hypothetical protein
MTSAKIRIKVGSMELDYEGDPSFLTVGIGTLLVTMGDLAGRIKVDLPPSSSDKAQEQIAIGAAKGVTEAIGQLAISTNTVAARLEAKTGPELVICAMAQLELVQGKASYGRAAILAEMKSATTYFKEPMGGNLSASLSSLTKSKRINQIATDSYALSATEKKKVEAKLAENE